MFKNFKKQDDLTITFDLLNQNVEVSLANAVRRILHAEIPITGILRETVRFHKNTSMLDGDFLSLRLALCPLINGVFESHSLDDIEIALNVSNKDPHMRSVYLSDFTIKNIRTEKTYSPDDVFAFPRIIFGKLRPKQEIILTASVGVGTAIKNKAQFSPVANASYQFEIDNAMVEAAMKEAGETDKELFMRKTGQRFYKQTADEQPMIYNFEVESTGVLPPPILVGMAIDVLNEKLGKYQTAILNGNEEKVLIKRSEKNMVAYDFIATDEDETLGNLISSYLHKDDKVGYAGFVIPHPLDNKMIITLGLKDESGFENTKKTMLSKIDELKKIVAKMSSDWASSQ